MKKHIQSPFTGPIQTQQPLIRDLADFGLFMALTIVDALLLKHFAQTFTEGIILVGLAAINIVLFTKAAVRVNGGGR